MFVCPFDNTEHVSFNAIVAHWKRCIKGRSRALYFCARTPIHYFATAEDQFAHSNKCAVSPLPHWKAPLTIKVSANALAALQNAFGKAESVRETPPIPISAAETRSPEKPSIDRTDTIKVYIQIEGRTHCLEGVLAVEEHINLSGLTFEVDFSPFSAIWATHLHRSPAIRQTFRELILVQEQLPTELYNYAFTAMTSDSIWIFAHFKNVKFGRALNSLAKVGNAIIVCLHAFPKSAHSQLAAFPNLNTYLTQTLALVQNRLNALKEKEIALEETQRANASPNNNSIIALQNERDRLEESVKRLEENAEANARQREAFLREISAQIDSVTLRLEKAEMPRIEKIRSKLREKELICDELRKNNLQIERFIKEKSDQIAANAIRIAAATKTFDESTETVGQLIQQLNNLRSAAVSPKHQKPYFCRGCRLRFSDCVAAPCMHLLPRCYVCSAADRSNAKQCDVCRRPIYAILNAFNAAITDS